MTQSATSTAVWQTSNTAPTGADEYSHSRTFIAVIPGAYDDPFACKTKNGKFYDIEACDRHGDWDTVSPEGLLWTEMPVPSAADIAAASRVVVTALKIFRPVKDEKTKGPVTMEFVSLEEASEKIGSMLRKDNHQFHAEARNHILKMVPDETVRIHHEDYRIEVKRVADHDEGD